MCVSMQRLLNIVSPTPQSNFSGTGGEVNWEGDAETQKMVPVEGTQGNPPRAQAEKDELSVREPVDRLKEDNIVPNLLNPILLV